MVALPLSYIPILESMHVYLNGVEQYEPADWSYNSVTNAIDVLSPMEAISSDLLEARYAHLGVVVPVAIGDFIDTRGGFTPGSTPTIVIPPHVAGDTLLLFLVLQGYTPSAHPVGWTYDGGRNVINDSGDSVTLHVYHKIGNGVESSTSETSGSGWTGWATGVYRGVTVRSVTFNDLNTPTNLSDTTSYIQTGTEEGRNVFAWGFRPQNNIATSGSTLRRDVGATNIGVSMSDQTAPGATSATKTGASAWVGAVVNLQ